MKRIVAFMALLSGSVWAQANSALDVPTHPSAANGPSYSQMYCSGFITRRSAPRTNFIVASKEAPHPDQFGGRTVLFLGGPGLEEGQRYSVIRQVEDPNREDSSPEQRKKLGKLGKLYQEIGWVTVRSARRNSTIATFDFSCDVAVPGDIVVPFQEKPLISFRELDPPINSFRPYTGDFTGHILGSKDFIGLLSSGTIVYTDYGAKKGAEPGDYLIVRRGYAPADLNLVDRLSAQLPKGMDPNAVNQAKIKPNANDQLPSHDLGELLVLNVTADSSTALIIRSFAEMELGDVVEGEFVRDGYVERTPRSCGIVSQVGLLLHFHSCQSGQ